VQLSGAGRQRKDPQTPADEIGTLEPGKLADIILLDGNPPGGIQYMLKTKMVLRGGKVVVDKR
jgi:imidazolonepropionase-like amidohydrolase